MNLKFLLKIAICFAFSCNCYAGLITIENDVQDIWWWNGVAEANNTELRTNDVSRSDQRIGVQFNDLSLLDDVIIESAVLQMYRYSGYWGSDADMTIDAYTITSSWHESSLIPNFEEYAIARTTYTDAEAGGWQSWNITELTQGWIMEEVDNNGVMLAGLGDNYFQRFYSSSQTGYGPRLVINTVEVSEPENINMLLLLAVIMLLVNRRQQKVMTKKQVVNSQGRLNQ